MASLELGPEVLCSNGKFAADSVLDIENGGVEVLERELLHLGVQVAVLR